MSPPTDTIAFREGRPDDIEGMAVAFCLAEPKSVWARAGNSFTTIYLRHYVYREDEVTVVADKDGEIVGACLGTVTGTSSLARFYRRETGALARTLLLHPRSTALFLDRAARGLISRMRNRRRPLAGPFLPPRCAYMALFYVVPKARGHQVGSRMLDRFCALVAARGAEWCWAQTTSHNVASRLAQERAGFECVGQREDDLWMLKRIAPTTP